MARRTRNRMELRDQFEAAERRKDEEETDEAKLKPKIVVGRGIVRR